MISRCRKASRPSGSPPIQCVRTPLYVGAAQSEYWAPCRIVVDVTEGGGDSLSHEAADGAWFTACRARSRGRRNLAGWGTLEKEVSGR